MFKDIQKGENETPAIPEKILSVEETINSYIKIFREMRKTAKKRNSEKISIEQGFQILQNNRNTLLQLNKDRILGIIESIERNQDLWELSSAWKGYITKQKDNQRIPAIIFQLTQHSHSYLSDEGEKTISSPYLSFEISGLDGKISFSAENSDPESVRYDIDSEILLPDKKVIQKINFNIKSSERLISFIGKETFHSKREPFFPNSRTYNFFRVDLPNPFLKSAPYNDDFIF